MACNETRTNGRIQVLLKSGIERVLMDLLNLGTNLPRLNIFLYSPTHHPSPDHNSAHNPPPR